jgi:hypothetical protein
MTDLTDAQRTLLNCYGSKELRDFVKKGELPDSPEVNARIAKRCLWENPSSWTMGKWFYADYVNAQFRSGRVAVRRFTNPDGEVRYTVVGPNGRWCDTLVEEHAKEHLKSQRKNGRLVYLTDKEAKAIERDWIHALSH